MNEKIYQFNEYVLGYDKDNKDRSCLTISKMQNGNMYVMSSLYDGSAEVLSLILDNLQQENDRLNEENKKFNKWIETLNKENHRLNNIINELERRFNQELELNNKWEVEDTQKFYSKKWYRDVLRDFKNMIKELKENNND